VLNLIISIPSFFNEDNFIKDSDEKKLIFILTGIITQSEKDKENYGYYISDYVGDATNNTWLVINEEKKNKKLGWANVWKNIVKKRHLPIALLYVRLVFIMGSFFLRGF